VLPLSDLVSIHTLGYRPFSMTVHPQHKDPNALYRKGCCCSLLAPCQCTFPLSLSSAGALAITRCMRLKCSSDGRKPVIFPSLRCSSPERCSGHPNRHPGCRSNVDWSMDHTANNNVSSNYCLLGVESILLPVHQDRYKILMKISTHRPGDVNC
jgi:hypothetical protein